MYLVPHNYQYLIWPHDGSKNVNGPHDVKYVKRVHDFKYRNAAHDGQWKRQYIIQIARSSK